MSVVWCFLGYLCGVYVVITESISVSRYDRVIACENFDCHSSDFISVLSVGSGMECVRACKSMGTCASVFYLHTSGQCRACSKEYGACTVSLPWLSGSVHYSIDTNLVIGNVILQSSLVALKAMVGIVKELQFLTSKGNDT